MSVIPLGPSQIKRGYIQRFGRTQTDLGEAEDHAHAKTSDAGGAKAYIVVEAFREDENVGTIFVTDADGHETLANDDRYVTTIELSSYGIDPEETS